MKRALLMLAVIAVTFAATNTKTPAPLPTSVPITLDVVKYNLELGGQGYAIVRVCNPLPSLSVVVLQFAAQGGSVLSPSAATKLLPNRCTYFNVTLIPNSKVLVLEYYVQVLAYYGGSTNTYFGKGGIALPVKFPKLLPAYAEASACSEANVTLRNAGGAPLSGRGFLILNNVTVPLGKVYVPPKGSTTVKFKCPCLPPGLYSGEVVVGREEASLTLLIVKSPIKLSIGSKVKYCTPVPAILKLLSTSGQPYPSQAPAEGCGELGFSLLSPKLPAVLKALLVGPGFSYSSEVRVQLALSAKPRTLVAGTTNNLTLKFVSNVPLEGSVSLEPSSGAVEPNTFVVRTNETVKVEWSLPPSAKDALLKVQAFGKEYDLKFVVAPYNPILIVTVKPKELLEGERATVIGCVRNAWRWPIKDATVTLSALGTNTQKFFKEIRPNQEVCLNVTGDVPWKVSSVKVRIVVSSQGSNKTFVETVPVQPNYNLASIVVTTNVTTLKPGTSEANVTVENVGSGLAKRVRVTFSSPDLLYPTSVNFGELRPGEKRVVTLKFFIPPGTAKEKVKAEVSYCSGPPQGSCLNSKATFELTFGVERYVPPTLQITSQSAVPSGKTTYLTLVIKNIGKGTAISPVLTLTGTKGVSIVGPNKFVLPDIGPGKEAKVRVKISTVATFQSAVASLQYSVSFSDEWGNDYKDQGTINFKLLPAKEPDVMVSLLTPTLPVGSGRTLTFKVANVGNVPAKNVVLDVFVAQMPSSNVQIKIGTLAPKQFTVAKVKVDVPESLAGQTVTAVAVVNYGNNTKTFQFNVAVVKGPVIKLQNVGTNPNVVKPGSAVIVYATLFNFGDRAGVVEVSVQPPQGFEAVGSRTVRVTVAPGQGVPVAFVLKAVNPSPGTHKVTITAKYSFAGQETVVRAEATIAVTPAIQVAQGVRVEYLGAIAGVALLLVLLKVLRRRKVEVVGLEE